MDNDVNIRRLSDNEIKEFEKKSLPQFKELIDECGLSQKGAARLLNVRYDTVKNWYYGRTVAPAGVMQDLLKYYFSALDIFHNKTGENKQ